MFSRSAISLQKSLNYCYMRSIWIIPMYLPFLQISCKTEIEWSNERKWRCLANLYKFINNWRFGTVPCQLMLSFNIEIVVAWIRCMFLFEPSDVFALEIPQDRGFVLSVWKYSKYCNFLNFCYNWEQVATSWMNMEFIISIRLGLHPHLFVWLSVFLSVCVSACENFCLCGFVCQQCQNNIKIMCFCTAVYS
jgi:hypothetical protein